MIKPFLSNRSKTSQKICLNDARIKSKDKYVPNVLNYFIKQLRSQPCTGKC